MVWIELLIGAVIACIVCKLFLYLAEPPWSKGDE